MEVNYGQRYRISLGGAICLIIAIIHSVMEKKISPAGILAIGLFIYGVYRVAIAKN